MSSSHPHLREDELVEPPTPAQERHIEGCTRCAARRAAALAVRAAIRGLPRIAEPPPAALALLDREAMTARASGRRKVALTLALAASFSVIAILTFVRARATAPMSATLAEEIALDHLHYERRVEAAEISGSLDQIATFFERTLARRPRLAAVEAATLVGGKRCRIGGQWSALIWLDRAGRWLSLFSMPQDAVTRRGCVQAAGVNVCGTRDPSGGARVLAGNLPDAEMLRLIDASFP